MQRKRAQVRRAEILEATVGQIQDQGMATLRIVDVAVALGVSPALVVYHFGTKESLLAEALRHAAERDLLKLRRIMRKPGTTEERLMAALEWYAPTGKARGWLIWVDAWAVASRDRNIADVLSDLQRHWTQAIADLVTDGVGNGRFDVDEPFASATRITALLDGLAVRTIVHGDRLERKTLLAWMARYVEWELKAAPNALGATSAAD